jgi:hypothetical protein
VYCRLVLVLIPSSNFIKLLLIQVSVKSGEGQCEIVMSSLS